LTLKTKHKPGSEFKAFYCHCLVEPNVFSKAQTAPADGYRFCADHGVYGTGVAVAKLLPERNAVIRVSREPKTSAWKRRSQGPLPELSRSRYARRVPVVVLQDGTVGTVMVPKQT
jgi:hypothetical protein